MPRYMPKTLAKTIHYVAYHAAGEYGLFWDSAGTMPWKELYWALQEDPSLRFVRQSHIVELNYLQVEIPIKLEDNLLHLRDGFPLPEYPVCENPPGRLFFACPRKPFGAILKHGLVPFGRDFLPLAADEELALRIGRRRDSKPLLVEVLAGKARAAGILFRTAGPELYLVESLAMEYLQLPPMHEEELVKLSTRKKEKASAKPASMPAPGSFLVNVDHFQEAMGAGKRPLSDGKNARKGKKGSDWKREARKGNDRRKRTV
ncbi:MAG: hypothetical protein RBS57_13245 [Desulforhabdus sp.]|nr:hypothetical protein [Desulforhabdus sp.]